MHNDSLTQLIKICNKTIIAYAAIILFLSPVQAQKMSVDELVDKHIQSLGKPEDVAQLKSRVLVGAGRLTSLLVAIPEDKGVVQFASQDGKTVFAMVFRNYLDYPYEKVAFDGKKITIGVPNGNRTLATDFLKSQSVVLKQGLFGGTLNSAWPLLSVTKKANLDYAGKGEWEGKSAYKLKFLSGTGGVNVTLFFETESFRHIGSEYKYTIPSSKGMPTYVMLTESFGNFKIANKVTFPFDYKLNVSSTANGSQEWSVRYTDIYFDQALDAEVFTVS